MIMMNINNKLTGKLCTASGTMILYRFSMSSSSSDDLWVLLRGLAFMARSLE